MVSSTDHDNKTWIQTMSALKIYLRIYATSIFFLLQIETNKHFYRTKNTKFYICLETDRQTVRLLNIIKMGWLLRTHQHHHHHHRICEFVRFFGNAHHLPYMNQDRSYTMVWNSASLRRFHLLTTCFIVNWYHH